MSVRMCYEYCSECDRLVDLKLINRSNGIFFHCKNCGKLLDVMLNELDTQVTPQAVNSDNVTIDTEELVTQVKAEFKRRTIICHYLLHLVDTSPCMLTFGEIMKEKDDNFKWFMIFLSVLAICTTIGLIFETIYAK